MLSDSQIKSLKIADGKRHADRDGLVLEIRESKKVTAHTHMPLRATWA